MRLLDVSGFRQWAEHKGLGWEQGPHAPCFGVAERGVSSPWPWPKPEGYARPWQLADLIVGAIRAAAFDETGGFYLWPTYGNWAWGRADDEPFYRVRNAILHAAGIPVGFEGAAYFSDAEPDALAACVFACCFMIDDCVGDAGDDSFIYPGHGRLYLHFDDEEIVWGMAASNGPLEAFDEGLRRLGWAWLRDEARNQWDWPLDWGS